MMSLLLEIKGPLCASTKNFCIMYLILRKWTYNDDLRYLAEISKKILIT